MVTITDFTGQMDRLVDRSEDMRLLADGFVFTEGPAWDKATQSLLFSDIQSDSRWRWSEEEGATLVAKPNFIGNGMVFDSEGRLLVCEHVSSTLVREHPGGCREVLAFHHQGTYLNSPNDVVTRSTGEVYFTDPDYGRWEHVVGVARSRDLGFTGLFRVGTEGSAELVADRSLFDQPNGLCFSPDEKRLYVNDLNKIVAFPVLSDGGLGEPEVFRSDMGAKNASDGDPDGMKCDAEGNIWCTARGGVWILSPSGSLLGIVETPEIAANLAWGGSDWRTLFLCTSTSIRSLRTKVPSARLPYH